MTNGLRRNIELKARCRDLAKAVEAARQLGAADHGDLRQVDTYFIVPNGRLKLRETEGKLAELIWYARPDWTDLRASNYHVLPIPAPAETKDALARALGIRGEIRKRRHLWLWHNVRIHLDEVEDLGSFIEFEAIMDPGADEQTSLQRLAVLRDALRITDDDQVAVSYSDLKGL